MTKRRSTPPDVPADRLAAYDRLLAAQPALERKGASLPYTSINGNMSSFVDGTGIALRLSAPDREACIRQFHTTLHQAHGSTMQEYVTIPDAALDDLPALDDWFARSVAYVSALRSKPTGR